MRRLSRSLIAILFCVELSSILATAYDTELSDVAVREAYFLGQRHSKDTKEFLALYARHFALPSKGPYISEIRALTPLAQVVEASNRQSSGYSAQQAWLDYRGRGDSIQVVVHIQFTPSYGVIEGTKSASDAEGEKGIKLRTEDFWQDFRFGIRQEGDWIEPRTLHGEPEYGGQEYSGTSQLVGAWVWIEFAATSVASEPTEVHVFTPDGQEVVATFDLARLK